MHPTPTTSVLDPQQQGELALEAAKQAINTAAQVFTLGIHADAASQAAAGAAAVMQAYAMSLRTLGIEPPAALISASPSTDQPAA